MASKEQIHVNQETLNKLGDELLALKQAAYLGIMGEIDPVSSFPTASLFSEKSREYALAGHMQREEELAASLTKQHKSDQLTSEVFPHLSQHDPDRFSDIQLDGIDVEIKYIKSLMAQVGIDREALGLAQGRITRLQDRSATILEKKYAAETAEEVTINELFITPEETDQLNAFVGLGIADAINQTNFRFLAKVNPTVTIRLKLRALESALAGYKEMQKDKMFDEVDGNIGFVNTDNQQGSEADSLQAIKDKIEIILEKKKQLLREFAQLVKQEKSHQN